MATTVRRSLSLVILFVAIATVMLSGLKLWARRSWNAQTQVHERRPFAAELAACARAMNLTFPPGTKGVMMRYVPGWLDDSIHLIVEIDLSELDRFLMDSPFAGESLSTTEVFVNPEPSLSWWNFGGVGRFQSGSAELQDAHHLNILIDMERDVVVMVYLEWFET